MKFPKILTVLVTDNSNNQPVEAIAVILELFATRKNNYIIGPRISDVFGIVQFTFDECVRIIKADQEMFAMDYADDMENCRSYLEIRTHLPAHIAQMIQQYERSPAFWGRRYIDAPSLFKKLHNVSNEGFDPAAIRLGEEQILEYPNVALPLTRRIVTPVV